MNWHEGSPDLLLDAHLSNAAYSGDNEVFGWQRDVELSTEHSHVYHKEGKAKVAYRGTHTWHDIVPDVQLAVGLQDYSGRFQKASQVAEKTIKKYGKHNVSLTGHSLGGSQAAYVSRDKGLQATGFNAAMSPVDSAIRKRTYGNFHSINTTVDPIAMYTRKTGRIKKTTNVLPTRLNVHGLANFI